MKIQSLGHVVLRVTDRKRAEDFYQGVLGMSVCARFDEQGMKMTFFSLGNHHDLAISEVPDSAAATKDGPGLDHVAFCIGTELKQLREAKSHLESVGIPLQPIDHEVTKSLYFDDPDGNTIELYVDVSDAWKADPQRVAQLAPLEL
ncbi:MAG: VOC family protein [Pseudomonadales bacterium]